MQKKIKVAISGANGFVGKKLLIDLLNQDYDVIAFVRNVDSIAQFESQNCKVYELQQYDKIIANENIDIFIHTAGIAHAKSKSISWQEYKKVNIDLTRNLFISCSKNNVKTFIFLSSIGVNGTSTIKPFQENDTESPTGYYALSKLEAEKVIKQEHENLLSTQYIIVRPPLIYGPNATGKFGALLKAVKNKYPLPLKGIDNKRGFIALENLSAFIIHCMSNEKATNETFLISDNNDISTSNFVKLMAKSFGNEKLIFPLPFSLINHFFKLIGKSEALSGITADLEIDTSKSRRLLDWHPPFTIENQMSKIKMELKR